MSASWSSVVLTLFIAWPAISWAQEVPEGTQEQSAYRLPIAVMGAAGAPGASATFRLNGTLAQSTPPGPGTAGGLVLQAGFWRALVPITTGVDSVRAFPLVTRLHRNFPNPFRASTTIHFSLANAQPTELVVYDVMGHRVKTVLREHRPPGDHTVTWTGQDEHGNPVASGVYFYRFRAGSYAAVRKLVIVK